MFLPSTRLRKAWTDILNHTKLYGKRRSSPVDISICFNRTNLNQSLLDTILLNEWKNWNIQKIVGLKNIYYGNAFQINTIIIKYSQTLVIMNEVKLIHPTPFSLHPLPSQHSTRPLKTQRNYAFISSSPCHIELLYLILSF